MMIDLSVKCPKCKKELADPEKLRQHRMNDHNFNRLEYMNLLMAK